MPSLSQFSRVVAKSYILHPGPWGQGDGDREKETETHKQRQRGRERHGQLRDFESLNLNVT